LPALKIGRSRRVRHQELLPYLQELAAGCAP
jgi:hypothetical protein